MSDSHNPYPQERGPPVYCSATYPLQTRFLSLFVNFRYRSYARLVLEHTPPAAGPRAPRAGAQSAVAPSATPVYLFLVCTSFRLIYAYTHPVFERSQNGFTYRAQLSHYILTPQSLRLQKKGL